VNAIKNRPYKSSARLVTGSVINVILMLMAPRLAVWSSDEREFRLALTVSVIGVVGVVSLFPVLIQGKGWQRVLGFLLLILPCLSFWFVFDFALKNK